MDISVLARVPLFSTLPDSDLHYLASVVQEEWAPANTLLLREGEPGDYLLILFDGEVEIYKDIDTPDQFLIAVRGPGELVGEMSLISPEQGRAASVRARTDVRVGRLSRSASQELLLRRPSLAFLVLRVVSERLRHTDQATISDLQRKNRQLEDAYLRLKEAQARLLEQERRERARQIAMANMEHELRLARRIQQSMLPRQLPTVPGWQFNVQYQPAREVGGDFYDFLSLPDGRLWLAIGDVTGKGVPAALVMATSRSTLRGVLQQARSPAQALTQVNEVLCEDMPSHVFVTCFLMLLDPRTRCVQFANAGHDWPVQRVEDKTVCLEATGLPLGLMPEAVYDEYLRDLEPGADLLLYSDGLIETHNHEGQMFGRDRLRFLFQSHPHLHGLPLLEQLLTEAGAFAGPEWEQEDDITLLTLHEKR